MSTSGTPSCSQLWILLDCISHKFHPGWPEIKDMPSSGLAWFCKDRNRYSFSDGFCAKEETSRMQFRSRSSASWMALQTHLTYFSKFWFWNCFTHPSQTWCPLKVFGYNSQHPSTAYSTATLPGLWRQWPSGFEKSLVNTVSCFQDSSYPCLSWPLFTLQMPGLLLKLGGQREMFPLIHKPRWYCACMEKQG